MSKKVSAVPIRKELSTLFLIEKCYRSCGARFCATFDGSTDVCTTPQIPGTNTLRPLHAVSEMARNSVFFIYRKGVKPYVGYSTLFRVCLRIFEHSCKMPTRKFRESQVLTSVGYLLLQIAFSNIEITCQGIPQFADLPPRLKWESMYTTIEGALHVIHEGDIMDDWRDRLFNCNQPV